MAAPLKILVMEPCAAIQYLTTGSESFTRTKKLLYEGSPTEIHERFGKLLLSSGKKLTEKAF